MDKKSFRAKIEELKSNLVRGSCASQVAMETRCKEEAYNEVLALLDEMPDEGVDYKRLNSMLDDALSKETEESWNERLDKKDYRARYKRIARSEQFKRSHEGMSIGEVIHIEGKGSVSSLSLVDKAARWFNDIADMCQRITTGNLSHMGATIRGKAIRAAEFINKHKEPVSEDLDDAALIICAELLKGETVIIDGYEYVVISDAEECFKAGANWQKKRMIDDAKEEREFIR